MFREGRGGLGAANHAQPRGGYDDALEPTGTRMCPFLFYSILSSSPPASSTPPPRFPLRYGMPVGPITLVDEVGIDVANHVRTFLSSADMGARMQVCGARREPR